MALANSTSPFAVLKRRNFLLMWIGQLVSTIGTSLASLAASIYVYRETDGSAFSVGLMLIVTAGPSLLFGLIAGVFVDRFDRKRMMLMADLSRAVIICLVPFLVPYGIVWLYIIVMLVSTIGQFFDPAYESVLPEVADDKELAAANSLMAISSFGATAVGFAASGLIASRLPIAYAFYIDGVSFLISAACIFFIRVRKLEVSDSTTVQVVIANLKTGIGYLFRNPVLRSIFMLSVPVAIGFGLSNTLLLPFATRALGATEFEYGVQEGVTSVGFVISSLLMAGLLNRWREGQWLTVSLIGWGVCNLVYSQLRSVPIAIGLMFVSGFINSPYAISRRVLVQRNSPPDMRGRVASAFFVSYSACFLIGMAAAGLADLVDVRIMYMFSGIIAIGCGFLAMGLPGLGQPAAEWKRALALLRTAPSAAGPGSGRPVQPGDVDLLVDLLPALSGLGRADRERIITQGRVLEVGPGTRLMQAGETGDSAYFILSGKAVAGVGVGQGAYHSLSTMTAGDYFGEIAALTGAARTADVVTEETTRLLQLPTPILKTMMAQPAFSRLVLARMSERLARTSLRELPRMAGVDQEDMRELREGAAEEAKQAPVPA